MSHQVIILLNAIFIGIAWLGYMELYTRTEGLDRSSGVGVHDTLCLGNGHRNAPEHGCEGVFFVGRSGLRSRYAFV